MNGEEFYNKLFDLINEANDSAEINNAEIVGIMEFTKTSFINSVTTQIKEKP